MPFDVPQVDLKKTRPRSDIRIEDLYEQIKTHGLRANWSLAQVCPCTEFASLTGLGVTRRRETRESQVNCPACGGTNYLTHSPQSVRVLTTTEHRDAKPESIWSMYEHGEVFFTFLPEQLPGFMDRITLTDCVIRYSEVRDRTGTVDVLRYPIYTRTIEIGSQADPTEPENKTVDVIFITKAESSGHIIVDSSGDAIELVRGTDFSIDGSGRIDWTLGSGVTTGNVGFNFNSSARTITRTDAGDFVADGWKVGAYVVVSGSVSGANDGTFYIASVTTSVITLTESSDALTTHLADTTASLAGGMAPAEGDRYSVSYFTNPAYRIINQPYGIRDTWIHKKSPTQYFKNMPVKALARLEWLGEKSEE
jgi:hypothetical protein